MEPGYAEAYAVWENENKEILYRLSPEERTQSFADFLEKEVHDRLVDLIDGKKELMELANRGQMLLASTDGGKTFDTFLTPEDDDKINPTDYLLLSPSFRSATTNLREVREEQSLIHAVSKLRDQHFLVERAWLDKGVVHVDAIHPRDGTYEVQIDLNQPSTIPLNYEFINEKGRTKVPESQLPEKYGKAELDINLQMPSEAEQLGMEIARKNAENQQGMQGALGAAMATWAAAKNLANPGKFLAAERAQKDVDQTREQMQKPLMFNKGALHAPNVMASKAAMNARFARQGQEAEESKKREAERAEKSKKTEQEYAKKNQAAQEAQQKKSSAAQMAIAKGAAIGAGAIGGILGISAGTTLFISHINLIS